MNGNGKSVVFGSLGRVALTRCSNVKAEPGLLAFRNSVFVTCVGVDINIV
jgi:hypothetical protein